MGFPRQTELIKQGSIKIKEVDDLVTLPLIKYVY